MPAIPRRPAKVGETDLPLSFAQQRLWFLDRWQPGNPVYNLPAAVRLRGPLDLSAFAEPCVRSSGGTRPCARPSPRSMARRSR